MSKDFIKKRQTKARTSASRQFLIVLAAYLCGYLTATIFDFTSLTTWVNKHILKTSPIDSGTKLAEHKPDLPKPKFEFYTLLAKDSSELIPKTALASRDEVAAATLPTKPEEPPIGMTTATSVTQQAALQTAKITDLGLVKATNAQNENYLIQIASFNKRPDAERLKASLLLRGFTASITEVNQRNIMWFRVIVGPFDSRQKAEKAQVYIARTERMKGMIRKSG